MQLIVGNLKMYLDGTEIKNYLDKIKEYEDENIVICPSSIHIPYFLNHKFKVGLQNISDKEKGALTGEISAIQGKNLGVSYTIIGHSERRNIFKETNEQINLKIKQALNQKLKVILCVGETLEQKEKNLTENIIRKELEIFLLELGHGYAYIGKEVRMGESYCDLLFFNVEYDCYVVIELKTRKLQASDVGQIEGYINYIDKNIKKERHNNTIGIIMTKENNYYVMKYCSNPNIYETTYRIIPN